MPDNLLSCSASHYIVFRQSICKLLHAVTYTKNGHILQENFKSATGLKHKRMREGATWFHGIFVR